MRCRCICGRTEWLKHSARRLESGPIDASPSYRNRLWSAENTDNPSARPRRPLGATVEPGELDYQILKHRGLQPGPDAPYSVRAPVV